MMLLDMPEPELDLVVADSLIILILSPVTISGTLRGSFLSIGFNLVNAGS